MTIFSKGGGTPSQKPRSRKSPTTLKTSSTRRRRKIPTHVCSAWTRSTTTSSTARFDQIYWLLAGLTQVPGPYTDPSCWQSLHENKDPNLIWQSEEHADQRIGSSLSTFGTKAKLNIYYWLSDLSLCRSLMEVKVNNFPWKWMTGCAAVGGDRFSN